MAVGHPEIVREAPHRLRGFPVAVQQRLSDETQLFHDELEGRGLERLDETRRISDADHVAQPEVVDQVDVAGKQGTVKSIDLRYTELTADVGRILIPNQSTFNNAVVVKAAA